MDWESIGWKTEVDWVSKGVSKGKKYDLARQEERYHKGVNGRGLWGGMIEDLAQGINPTMIKYHSKGISLMYISYGPALNKKLGGLALSTFNISSYSPVVACFINSNWIFLQGLFNSPTELLDHFSYIRCYYPELNNNILPLWGELMYLISLQSHPISTQFTNLRLDLLNVFVKFSLPISSIPIHFKKLANVMYLDRLIFNTKLYFANLCEHECRPVDFIFNKIWNKNF